MTTITDLIAREAEAAEANPDAPEKPGTVVTRGTPRGRTLQVRLTSDEYDALDRAAAAADLPVSSYARTLLLAAQPAVNPNTVIARIRMDLDKLTALTGPTPAKTAAKKTTAKKATPAKAAARKTTAKKATSAKAAAKKATAKKAPRYQRAR